MEKIVGINVKTERERKGFTLRKLANQIQVSASFLSQVETGKAIPSLATLIKLADALQTTIGKLVGEGQESIEYNPIITKKKRFEIDRLGHGLNIELLASQDVNNMMQPYILSLKPQGDTGPPNKHAGQECGVVLEDSLEMYLDKKRYELNTGDSFYYNANIPHYIKNVTNRVSKVFYISTPPLF